MSNRMEMPVSLLNPFKQFSCDKNISPEYMKGISPQLAIATGLALRTIPL
jgi:Tfp pilus assembly PilM family ATPase